MNTYKFELGDMVTHITHKKAILHKMVIIGRYFLESAIGYEENYIASSDNIGQIVRHRIGVEELAFFEEQ